MIDPNQARLVVGVIGMMVVGVARLFLGNVPLIVGVASVIMRVNACLSEHSFRMKVRSVGRLLNQEKQKY